jgi:tRNA-Thr(GGU) m(6)t(6)A37 methyltransferase TsaA
MIEKDQNSLKFQINPIGYIQKKKDKVYLSMLPDYKPGLEGLYGFSHLQVLWWFSHFDDLESRKTLRFDKMPFQAPELGVFACRSPMRPNPIGLSTVRILTVNDHFGEIEIAAIDADDQSPIIDLKPYLPSCDRVKEPKVADWASSWSEWTPT